MARPRIRKSSDTGFVTTGTRTIGWEIFDTESGSVLQSSSEVLPVSHIGPTATVQAGNIRNVLDSRIGEYLDTNTYTEPEEITTAPAVPISTTQLGGGTGASASTFWRGDGAWATPGGGSDPWTYVRVTGADFTTTSATAVDVTGLAFTPAANLSYEFEAVLMIRTATTTVNPRVGLAWATGGTDGVAIVLMSQVAAGNLLTASGNINAALLTAVGAMPNTTQSWPAKISGMFIAGASPSGTVRVQLASETAGTTVRVVLGSFLRWRTF